MQPIIGMVYDFDITLSPHYMQRHMFEAFGIREQEFWTKKDLLVEEQLGKGKLVQPDTAYLQLILNYAKPGNPLEGITETALRELGANIVLYPGIPEFFAKVSCLVAEDAVFSRYGVSIEHYVVSTGLAEMIRGSAIAPFMKHIEACEFFYDASGRPVGVSNAITHTQRTEALFKINKGSYHDPSIDVNANMPEECRRIPLNQIIYIGDGPSDVPCMSVVKRSGGINIGVYNPSPENPRFISDPPQNALALHRAKRTDFIFQADYREGSDLFVVVSSLLRDMARDIVENAQKALGLIPPPMH